MVGEPLRLDARGRELVPELADALGDGVEWVLVNGDELDPSPPVVIGGRLITIASEEEGGSNGDRLVLEAMPGDVARSATTFLMGLPDGSVLVPELGQDAFDAIGLVHERSLGRLVQTFLDVQVAELEQRDVAVRRLPMMAATDLERVLDRPESWVGRFTSPTQSVLANGRALCPRQDEARFDDAYRALADAHRTKWSELFGSFGVDVTFVDVGALHERGLSLCSLVVR